MARVLKLLTADSETGRFSHDDLHSSSDSDADLKEKDSVQLTPKSSGIIFT